MAVESENSNLYDPEIDLLVCPLVDLCELPKHHFPCKIPECKVLCSEYLSKIKSLSDLKI